MALPKTKISLLQMNGFEGPEKRPSFSSHVIEVDTQPKYAALSYVWGTDIPAHEIYLNDQSVLVRKNLYDFFHNLTLEFWEYGRAHHWKYLWIDALCIDQSNIVERNQQVSMMDRIYSEVAIVIVWMGQLFGDIPRDLPQWREEQRQEEQQRHRDYVGLNGFLDAVYWDRTWTVQEFILARKVHFFWINRDGERMDMLAEEAMAQMTSMYKLNIGFIRGGRAYLSTLYDKLNGWLEDSSLLDWMLEFYSCECLDKRDRIFALMGLVKQEERELLSIFFPDYGLDHETVVIITLAIMQHVNATQILGHQSGEVFEDAKPMSENFHEKAHGSSWPSAVLSVMGVEITAHEEVAKWQAAVDAFNLEAAKKQVLQGQSCSVSKCDVSSLSRKRSQWMPHIGLHYIRIFGLIALVGLVSTYVTRIRAKPSGS
ncbi:hypothetical protein CBER1_10535 [Cercospora berteroae]|uniref:Heterokaryon incompatibility domain-containing protein n=1 Tax=Cercospora berteroae TaxID=357750 RepID=A0A2S6CCV7_9PEZI|nr:hypothetical protein CBER1_10535 [Cercospora berteroae]